MSAAGSEDHKWLSQEPASTRSDAECDVSTLREADVRGRTVRFSATESAEKVPQAGCGSGDLL